MNYHQNGFFSISALAALAIMTVLLLLDLADSQVEEEKPVLTILFVFVYFTFVSFIGLFVGYGFVRIFNSLFAVDSSVESFGQYSSLTEL